MPSLATLGSCPALLRQLAHLGTGLVSRPASDSAEKPANTTEKTAPMREQASCTRVSRGTR